MANINNYFDFINDSASEDPAMLISDAEERYANIVDMTADKILERGGAEIVMLAGPSSSGKTTTAKRLKANLEQRGYNVNTISLDDFYLDKGTGPKNSDGSDDYESVHALDIPCLKECLLKLLNDGFAEFPEFDFTSGKRLAKSRGVALGKNDVIIIEGLHALNPIITDTLPKARLVKIYISLSSRIYNEDMGIVLNKRNLRFTRRLVRDYKFRGSSTQNTFTLWDNVLLGENIYLMPYRELADIKINSIHIYEPCVFRNEAIKLLDMVDLDSEHYPAAQRLIKSLKKFKPLPAELVPQTSLLREFLGY